MTDTSGLRPIVFWLVPSQPWRSRIADLIVALGRAHGGPAFEPHITIEVSHAPAGAALEAVLDRVARGFEPMTLVAGTTAHSAAHFRTLFVEFDDARLPALQRRLREELGRDEGYALHPHLSLLYRGDLPLETRVRLAATHRFAGERIEFDLLVAVQPSLPGGDLSDIETIDTSLRVALGDPKAGP